MLAHLRVAGPAVVALIASLGVWALVMTGDPIHRLYSLNLATRASTYGYLFVGAAAAAYAAVEAGLPRRRASSLLVDSAGARAPAAVALRRLRPVLAWFSAALIAVVAGAALLGGGPLPAWQVAAVMAAAVAALWLSIGVGAIAGRFLPFGLGPLVGTLSTYAVYVPAVLSEGRGPWAIIPIGDVQPAPHFVIRPDGYALGAGMLAAVAVLLISLSGARVGRPVLPVAASIAALALAAPLASVTPREQHVVLLEAADDGTRCQAYGGAQLCVLAVDDRFLGTLEEGTRIAWPVLRRYAIEPSRIAEVDSVRPGDDLVEVDARSLDAGARPTAASIIDGAVAGKCDLPTIEPVTALPWEVIIAATLRAEVGLGSAGTDAEPARRLAAMSDTDRDHAIRDILAAIDSCASEHL